ncbi:MAG TPA: hypothetical protein DCY12_01325 [Candidatus Atribacteria bacterium]|nr:hypothetical protein [Candidatus Atribacteria bacterium]
MEVRHILSGCISAFHYCETLQWSPLSPKGDLRGERERDGALMGRKADQKKRLAQMPAAFHLDQSCLVAVIEVVELGHPAEHGFLLGFGQRGPVIRVVGHEKCISCREGRGQFGCGGCAVEDVELGGEHLGHELVNAIRAHVAEDGDSLFRGVHYVVSQGDGQPL